MSLGRIFLGLRDIKSAGFAACFVMCPFFADAAILKQAHFETGNFSEITGSCTGSVAPNGGVDGKRVDTFDGFGIPPLPNQNGTNHAVNLHSVAGTSPAGHIIFTYNACSAATAWVRFYFFIPRDFQGYGDHPLKFALLRCAAGCLRGGGDQDVYLGQSGSNFFFNWQHSIVGYNSQWGSNKIPAVITSGAWHYLEVNLNADTGVVRMWYDKDAALYPNSPIWTNSDETSAQKANYSEKISHVGFNENWSGRTSPKNQDWHIDGIAYANAPVGDTYGLLSGGTPPPPPPPQNTEPPAKPKGLILK